MQTTICAYCDHEVKITPDGVCLYCGGNLADEPISENDPQEWETIKENILISRKSGREKIDLFFNEVKENYVSREEKVKAEMQKLDNFTKVVGESETVKTLVKSLGKPIIPLWFKFGAFLLGLIIGTFYAFPDIQIPLLETITLINNSPYLVTVISIVPIIFLLVILKKFNRRMF